MNYKQTIYQIYEIFTEAEKRTIKKDFKQTSLKTLNAILAQNKIHVQILMCFTIIMSMLFTFANQQNVDPWIFIVFSAIYLFVLIRNLFYNMLIKKICIKVKYFIETEY